MRVSKIISRYDIHYPFARESCSMCMYRYLAIFSFLISNAPYPFSPAIDHHLTHPPTPKNPVANVSCYVCTVYDDGTFEMPITSPVMIYKRKTETSFRFRLKLNRRAKKR